jgi:branched-chain amino acid transport system permease protein
MIGGIGSFFGPIVGVAIFQLVDELILRYTESTELVMGVILILVVMFMPMGFMGLIKMLIVKVKTRYNGKAKMEKAS